MPALHVTRRPLRDAAAYPAGFPPDRAMTLRTATLRGTEPGGTRLGFRLATRTHGHGRYVTAASIHGHGAPATGWVRRLQRVGRYTVARIGLSASRAHCGLRVMDTHFIAALTHALDKFHFPPHIQAARSKH